MTLFQLGAVFLTLVAAGGWLNAKTLRLPNAVAMLLVGVGGALTLGGLRRLGIDRGEAAILAQAVGRIDFSQTILGYLLAFLLFAGAMQVDLAELRRRLLSVWTLATMGVAASTVIVGAGLWLIAGWLEVPLSLPWAFVFGALISPTDPIAVIATVKRGHFAKSLQAILQGEALFNDGVGIVVFTALVAFAGGAEPSAGRALFRVVLEAGGGLALGVVAGAVVIRAMRGIDDFAVEVALSLALAMGSYAAAQALGLSGPIAVVGAGLVLGAGQAREAMSATTRQYLRNFWTLVDEILNALVFLLLGLELLVVPMQPSTLVLSAAAVILVLATRFAVVAPWGALLGRATGQRHATLILGWGGLHGALSLALAMSVPPGPHREPILTAAYAVAVFSVAVQGLSFGPLTALLARRSVRPEPETA
jgi:CPA1 family monovalent cation:H+ antiporter